MCKLLLETLIEEGRWSKFGKQSHWGTLCHELGNTIISYPERKYKRLERVELFDDLKSANIYFLAKYTLVLKVGHQINIYMFYVSPFCLSLWSVHGCGGPRAIWL